MAILSALVRLPGAGLHHESLPDSEPLASTKRTAGGVDSATLRAEFLEENMMKLMKHWIAALAAVAGTVGAAGAQAANVYWSVGIQTPPISTVISNAPGYQSGAPSYYAPAPVYYQPAPVYYQPAPAYVPPQAFYRPAPVYVVPPVVYQPTPVVVYGRGGNGHGHWKGHGHGQGHGQWQRRDEYGTHHRGDWDGRRRHH